MVDFFHKEKPSGAFVKIREDWALSPQSKKISRSASAVSQTHQHTPPYCGFIHHILEKAMQQPPKGGLERAIGGFANASAAITAIMLLPILARYCRHDIHVFMTTGLDYELALWGSWTVILLGCLSVYFGVSTLLQVLLLLLFRRGSRPNSSPF